MVDLKDPETATIVTVCAALDALPDPEARARVLSYVTARYAPGLPSGRREPGGLPSGGILASPPASGPPSAPPARTSANEIPGIARLLEDGGIKLTVRDLKAKSGLDAALRLAHVAIFAYSQLTEGQPLSSRRGLTPLLKEWRLYDGNARARLAKERGILRSGDDLSLDAHAQRDAERYIQEILDEGLQGTWRPR